MINKWYRIDLTDVSIREVAIDKVRARADDLFGLGAQEAMTAGRFRNPWAFYVRHDKLTNAERDLPITFTKDN